MMMGRVIFLLSVIACVACEYDPGPYGYYNPDPLLTTYWGAEALEEINDEAGCELVYWAGSPEHAISVEFVPDHEDGESILGCATIGEAFKFAPKDPILISSNAIIGPRMLIFTIVHEVGHTLGLRHVAAEGSVMSGNARNRFDVVWHPDTSQYLQDLCAGIPRF